MESLLLLRPFLHYYAEQFSSSELQHSIKFPHITFPQQNQKRFSQNNRNFYLKQMQASTFQKAQNFTESFLFIIVSLKSMSVKEEIYFQWLSLNCGILIFLILNYFLYLNFYNKHKLLWLKLCTSPCVHVFWSKRL